jgi:Xaa-Pro aminopeptidase
VLQQISTASSAEAAAKRTLARAAAADAGYETLVATSPATVRWLLCGRGRPVSTSSSSADYTVVLTGDADLVLFPDIEASRATAEERFQELAYEPVPFPWHEGPDGTIAELVGEGTMLTGAALEEIVSPLRRELSAAERERYRTAGKDVADAMVETLLALDPDTTEVAVAAELAARVRRRGFFPPVVLVAGDQRQSVHRHPLPTDAQIGRHALLAVTAERDGLHVSMTRLASFGAPSHDLRDLVRKASFVDAAALDASRPGKTLGHIFARIEEAYAAHGFPGEWRRHHQGGLTGYSGREVFAVPGDPTVIPPSAAVAWNPSITGGAKSEDTALVTEEGIEVVTRTPELPEFDFGVVPRPAITEL